MISEKKFASIYTSFWQDLLPLGESYLRSQNLQLDRFCPPIDSKLSPERLGIVNELSFRLFRIYLSKGKKDISRLTSPMVDEEARKLAKYASQFKGGSKKNKERINDAEKKEAIVLMRRLNDFFAKKHSNIQLILSPIFPGCGKIDDCEGDVLVSTVLYEIKAGDRNFRLIDIKQVLTYCALNYAAQRYKIEKIGLINPRKGVFFLQPLDQLARGLAGTTPSQILSDIMDFISQSFSSR